MVNAFFSDLLSTISERGRTLLRRVGSFDDKQDVAGLIELCEALLSGRGEASGTAMAREVLDRYHHLDPPERLAFFETLARNYGPDPKKLAHAIEVWRTQPNDDDASDLHYASEPRRQELIRRLNRAPGGTAELVAMRADLLNVLKDNKDKARDLGALDRDIAHLLSSWFNRGFLVLRRIDWSSPANILEKIIRYEAVHQIRDWDDLRRRIDPVDRRCYAFFHPTLIDEPLIFVEVALTEAIPGAIAPLLSEDRQPVPIDRARTAVFYSISNTQTRPRRDLFRQLPDQAGSRGAAARISQAGELRDAVAGARPDAMAEAGSDVPVNDEGRALLGQLDAPDWPEHAELAAQLRSVVEPLASYYFLKARTPKGRLIDPVARFHLGNGARLERINWLGDLSPKALRKSAASWSTISIASRISRRTTRPTSTMARSLPPAP